MTDNIAYATALVRCLNSQNYCTFYEANILAWALDYNIFHEIKHCILLLRWVSLFLWNFFNYSNFQEKFIRYNTIWYISLPIAFVLQNCTCNLFLFVFSQSRGLNNKRGKMSLENSCKNRQITNFTVRLAEKEGESRKQKHWEGDFT